MLGALLVATWFCIALGVGCGKKKNEAAKLKPRNLDKPPLSNPSAQSPAPNAPSTSQQAGSAQDKPPSKMVPREADDNETINDAKSDWGVVQ